MGLRRTRAATGRIAPALVAVVSLMMSSAMLLGAGGAASAQSGAPSVSVRLTDGDAVAVSGRTRAASAPVRFERLTPVGWSFVKRVRAHAHRYATTLWASSGTTQTFRATSKHRSRTFVVAVPDRKAPTGSTTPPSPTTKPPAPVKYDDCGARPLKADGSAWSCTFHDDFDGTALDSTKWVPQTVGYVTGDAKAGYACYVNDPQHVAVASGMLTLTIRREPTPVPCGSTPSSVTTQYTAGSVSTYHLFSQQYGRFEARIRNTAASVAGLQESFWLWPDDRYPSTVKWPTAGEIDIAEAYSIYPDIAIPFLHYSADSGGPQPGLNTAWNCTAPRGQWNTYTLDWAPSSLTIYVNGTRCLTNTSGDVAFQKRYILALTAALGVGTNAMTAATPIPAAMDIDYVRVWQ